MINLLPPEEKENLLKERKFREISILGITIFISLSFFALILFFVEFDLRNNILSQNGVLEQKKKELEIARVGELEKEIESINQNLLKLNSFYQGRTYLTEIFEDLARAMPEELYLKEFLFKEEGEISISGFSPRRETLTSFKDDLEREESFKDIYFPPSCWTKPVDINFNATFKIQN